MTTFLASFLVFLGAAAALALGGLRGRPTSRRCGGCAARESGDCGGPARTSGEAG